VWAALGRLAEPLRLVVVLRYFTGVSSYAAIADLCSVPVGTVRSRLNAARTRLATELLETAAAAHPHADLEQRRAIEAGLAMAAFERTGDARELRGALAPDLSFRLADRTDQHGRDLFASLLAADFDAGVSTRPIRVLGGAELSVFEVWLDSPPDQPLHCPPALTQVHIHHGAVTRQILSHYAQPPSTPAAPRRSARHQPMASGPDDGRLTEDPSPFGIGHPDL
jgi:RNA polymerase sigma-70 factor (ECF subfamily)